MRVLRLTLCLLVGLAAGTVSAAEAPLLVRADDGFTSGPSGQAPSTESADENARAALCRSLSDAAAAHDVPLDFFVRLIWKESRFNPNAVSPVGAQGIAQFMPYTARAWGLSNPFDPAEALPASASLLRWLADRFDGHWGLAAMAYNAGADRVRGFLDGGFLPYETRDYVFAITGRTADDWRLHRSRELAIEAVEINLDPHPPIGLLGAQPDFGADKPADPPLLSGGDPPSGNGGTISVMPTRRPADLVTGPVDCEALVVALGEGRATPRRLIGGGWSPWGAQVAGHANPSIAMRQFARVQRTMPAELRSRSPVVVSKRVPGMGRRQIHAVQLGAPSRQAAQTLCARISASGAACVVVRN
ncbi:lytic transglycosylase domain-containing protein [Amorphus sp. 3PC139-8]|uniref:lytic transglycosylase domain-containing protein n=1 Tax=Amorphus sp. 3PC139-8 TaxID=2735676 RepID=UPI00345DD782